MVETTSVEMSAAFGATLTIDLPRDRDLSIRETPEFARIAVRLRAGLGKGA